MLLFVSSCCCLWSPSLVLPASISSLLLSLVNFPGTASFHLFFVAVFGNLPWYCQLPSLPCCCLWYPSLVLPASISSLLLSLVSFPGTASFHLFFVAVFGNLPWYCQLPSLPCCCLWSPSLVLPASISSLLLSLVSFPVTASFHLFFVAVFGLLPWYCQLPSLPRCSLSSLLCPFTGAWVTTLLLG